MKFAIVHNTIVLSIHDSYEKASDNAKAPAHSVEPIMPLSEYLKLTPDYRGFFAGRPTVLYMIPGVGSVSGPVYLIGSWQDWQRHDAERESMYQNLIKS